jgi:FkbM family methyltransferase
MDSFYQSQYQQDKILNEEYFKNKVGGVFVDIGAHDGKSLSNTYFYEKILKWTGLCIEPLPKVFKQLKENRSCILIEGAAWKEDTTKQFRIVEGYPEMLSGFIDTYPDAHQKRIADEIALMGGSSIDVDIKCFNVTRLLLEHKLTEIDFLSIDVEGSELDILESIDYEKIKINVILAENNYNDSRLASFLETKGYELAGRISIDDVFVKVKK